MLRRMWNLQPIGFDQGALAYAEMLLQMDQEKNASAVKLSENYKRVFDYKVVKKRNIK